MLWRRRRWLGWEHTRQLHLIITQEEEGETQEEREEEETQQEQEGT